MRANAASNATCFTTLYGVKRVAEASWVKSQPRNVKLHPFKINRHDHLKCLLRQSISINLEAAHGRLRIWTTQQSAIN